MNSVTIAVDLAYLVAAAGFVVALHLMNSPATARKGSRLSWLGMIVAVAAALTSVIHDETITATGWIVLSVGGVGGAAAGLVMARRVKMTAVPQVVSIFNAVGGGAAALVAAGDFVRLSGGQCSPADLAELLPIWPSSCRSGRSCRWLLIRVLRFRCR